MFDAIMNPLSEQVPISPIEIAATIFGLLSVWFYTREKVWSWPTGLLMVLLYIVIFYRVKLYADMGLQVVFVFLQVYGWHQWVRGGDKASELHVTKTSARLWLILLLVGLALFFPMGMILSAYTDTDVPYIDATTTVTSLIAQWMISKKKLENWWIWILTDLIAIPLYVYKGIYLTAGLYVVFLILCLIGMQAWRVRFRSTSVA